MNGGNRGVSVVGVSDSHDGSGFLPARMLGFADTSAAVPTLLQLFQDVQSTQATCWAMYRELEAGGEVCPEEICRYGCQPDADAEAQWPQPDPSQYDPPGIS